jgi:hypothetical protein
LRYTRRRFRRLYKIIAQFGPHSTRRLHILAAHEPLARRDWDHPLGSAETTEIRNASDSVTKIANRSALHTGNTPSLSVAVDREQKKSRRAKMADGILQRDATAPQRKT